MIALAAVSSSGSNRPLVSRRASSMPGCVNILRSFERTLLNLAVLGAGWWLWPDGFLYGPLADVTPKTVLLASLSMGAFAIGSLMAIFSASEPLAALLRKTG